MQTQLIQPAPRKVRKPQRTPPTMGLINWAKTNLVDLKPGTVLVITLAEEDESRFAFRDAFLTAEAEQPEGTERRRLRVTTSRKDGKGTPWMVQVRSLRKAAGRPKKAQPAE